MKKHNRLVSRRGRLRGAIFVEAIIVVSFFTLCFLGVLYFRELYVKKLDVQRLARASAMAHAMGACNVDPKAGLDKDLPPDQPPQAPPATGSGFPLGTGNGFPLTPPTDTKTQDVIAKLSQDNGGTPLDKITGITVSTTASATTQKDAASPKQGFTSAVSSESFVTCADPVRPGGVTNLTSQLGSVLETIFGKK